MKQKVISFHYTLKDKAGQQIDSSRGGKPMDCLEGDGQIIPGLETELKKMKKGEAHSVMIPAAQAYGTYDPRFVITVDRDQMPKGELKVGQEFEITAKDGGAVVVVVTEVTKDQVTMDGNHPLAGQDLYFEVEIVSVREATDEEISHGHAHGAGGHHH